ncbi:MAG: hypothetical protein D6681_20190 [Calditrichaeota bacterium]|nr:MAG: hypothetical protein D6681_20190 [Calditrichota bacterium]
MEAFIGRNLYRMYIPHRKNTMTWWKWLIVGLLTLILSGRVTAGDCFASASQDYWYGCLGDIDADGDVDDADLAFVAARIGSTELAADVDLDGAVTQDDVDLVAADLGSECAWPPEHHAVLRLVADDAGADIWLDLPAGSTVSGIQCWLLTSPDSSGRIEPNPDVVGIDICGRAFGSGIYDQGRIGFSFGAFPLPIWQGSVRLCRLHGPLGEYVLLYRLAAPPARCSEQLPNGQVRGLRFIVVVERNQRQQGKRGSMVPRPR